MELDYETCIDDDEVDEFTSFKTILQGNSSINPSCGVFFMSETRVIKMFFSSEV